MDVVLVGGGPDTTRSRACVAPFVAACRVRGATRIGVLLVGDRLSANHFAPAYLELLAGTDAVLDVVALDEGPGDPSRFDAVVVGGGPTPAYHDALTPVMTTVRAMVRAGVPYLGFSAGAMVAAERAIVGGYVCNGVPVCSPEWSEGLEEVTVRHGIGVVPWSVEVHAAQAGTLGRAIVSTAAGAIPSAVALDEDTALHVGRSGEPTVLGSGRAWWMSRDGEDLRMTVATAQAGTASVPGRR